MQYVAVLFVTQYNSSLSNFVPNLRILTQVVAEKSLTGKKVYKQTNKQTQLQKRQKLYTPYILRAGGIINVLQTMQSVELHGKVKVCLIVKATNTSWFFS